MKNFLLMLLGVLMTLPTFARDFTYTYEGQTLTYTVVSETDKTCMTKAGDYENGLDDSQTLKPGNVVTGDLVIPSEASDGENDYTVISIGDCAFARCNDLNSVSIQGSVTSIGEGAFFRCNGLTSVTIPDSVISIGDFAFYVCSGLTSVKIPDSVISIGNDAFYSCESLKKAEFESIESLCRISFASEGSNPLSSAQHLYINGEEISELVIPGSVTSIGNVAFDNCKALTSVTIPASVTSIGNGAFRFCDGLTSVSIPGSVTSIGYCAFQYCRGLTSVAISQGVTSIGEGAFYYCDALTSVTIPGSVTSIGDEAFEFCRGLTSVTISQGVTSIGEGAFDYCDALTSVTIPGSVTSIGDGAFFRCYGVTSITIPGSVTSIGDRAFADCSNLTSVYYGADNPIASDANVFSTDTYEKATLYMSEKGASMGRMIDPWKNFKNIEEYEFTGVEEMEADINPDKPYEVYDLKGAKVCDSTDVLTPGLYIIRQGNATKKAVIK